jgi:hypothetical protein
MNSRNKQNNNQQDKTLADIIAEEAIPNDVLLAIALSTDSSLTENICGLLQTILQKAALTSTNSTLSMSRMRLKSERLKVEQSLKLKSKPQDVMENEASETLSIWRSMANGKLSITK